MDRSILSRPEYDFLQTNRRLRKNVVLLGLGGSHAYGTNIEGSDVDIRGVATRSAYDICTGYDFEEIVNNETDTTIYSFDKMLRLLAECNPNCIEILGLRKEDYFLMSPVGKQLLLNKSMFLSKNCIHTFGGYATQQLYRLRQKTLDALSPDEYNRHIVKTIEGMKDHLENSWHIPAENISVVPASDGLKISIADLSEVPIDDFYGMCNEIANVIRTYNKNSKRNEHAMAHAKVHKHAMHLLRLYMMAIDILEKKEIITYRENEHDLLMAIRNGEFTDSTTGMMTTDFWDLLSKYETKFNQAKEITTLPDKPDESAIKDFQNDINSWIIIHR